MTVRYINNEPPNECKSGICKGFEETDRGKGSFVKTGNSKPRVFNDKGESIFVCYWCRTELTKHPEKYLCKVPGCRVLHNVDSEFCFRHDKDTVIPEVKLPELE